MILGRKNDLINAIFVVHGKLARLKLSLRASYNRHLGVTINDRADRLLLSKLSLLLIVV